MICRTFRDDVPAHCRTSVLSWQLFVVAALLCRAGFQVNAATNAAEEANVPQLAPPYPELPPTFWERYGLVLALAVVLLLALVGLSIWLGLRKKPPTVLPPEVLARRELNALAARPEDCEVLSRTSQILRRYFVAAFRLPAGEYTTAEFCRMAGNCEAIGADLTVAAAEFLRECDERKFSVSAAPLSGVVARALALVDRGEALRHPAETPKA